MKRNGTVTWLGLAALGALMVCVAAEARAAAVIETALASGPPGPPGTQFQVLVRVRQNDTGDIPVSCSFRVFYPSNAVELVSAIAGDLGDPVVKSVQGAPPDVYQDVITVGKYTSSDLVPDCFTLVFRALGGDPGLYSINVGDNPVGVALLSKDLEHNIAHTFDNNATQGLGDPPPVSADPSVSFEFAGGVESWRFVAAPPFTSPTPSYLADSGGALELVAASNSNCFGYWEGPRVDLSPAGSLYTAEFMVRSSIGDLSKTPQIRLRSSSANVQQARFMTLESRDDGLASPGPDGTTYTLLLSPGPGAEIARVEFEMLNFDPNDDAAGDVQLDWVRITRRNPADLSPRQPISTFYFSYGADNWTPHGTSAFSAPTFDTYPGVIKLTGTGRADVFGYWSSPELPGGFPVPPTANPSARPLYIATFDVETDVTDSNRAKVPQFRVRLNESRGRAASYMAVESKGDALLSPVAGLTSPYVIYYLPPIGLADRSTIASFDFLNFDSADDSRATLQLTRMSLEVVPYPW